MIQTAFVMLVWAVASVVVTFWLLWDELRETETFG